MYIILLRLWCTTACLFSLCLSSSLLVAIMGVSQLNCQRRINRFVGVCAALTELMAKWLLYCINYGEKEGGKDGMQELDVVKKGHKLKVNFMRQ
uniref:Secreted protein n=1 Tax=Echinococcus canadensis TaxID=519352 RepID=A0A915EXA1_9CEST